LRFLVAGEYLGTNSRTLKQFGKAKDLESLNLSSISTRSADFSGLANLTKLKQLDVRDYRNLTDCDMTWAKEMKNLKAFRLKNNFRVTDKGLTLSNHARNLEQLMITKIGIDGSGLSEWPADHAGTSILIEGCSITNDGVKAMSRLQNLKYLEVRVIRFGKGPIEVDVSCFADSKTLESISLLGQYTTSQESLDRLIKARPDIGIFCNISEQ